MAEDQQHQESKRGGSLPVLIMLLLLGYPLSTGPVAMLLEMGWLGPNPSFWSWFYRPLSLVTNRFPLIETLFNHFMNFWIELAR
ncbi:MAG: hypothetical protein KDA93_24460 [Planctomycetaceae bacterium]|nr:hypothetical protein [Planctomycetaceae bacterium]